MEKTKTQLTHEKLIQEGFISIDEPVIYGSERFADHKLKTSVKASVNPRQDLSYQTRDIPFYNTWYDIPEKMRTYHVIVADPGFAFEGNDWSDLFKTMSGNIYVNYDTSMMIGDDLDYTKEYGYQNQRIIKWIWLLSKNIKQYFTIDKSRVKQVYNLLRSCGVEKFADSPRENNFRNVFNHLFNEEQWENYILNDQDLDHLTINENWFPDDFNSVEQRKLIMIKDLCSY